MTLFTLSKIKRVCTIILIPRIFRSDGCTPGKFRRLKYEASRKVHKSSSSGHSDDFRCKKCKRIIDRAFGPPQYYYYIEKPHRGEINNETNKLSDKKAITRLEDLKSKISAEAKANVLLRAREINTILASIDKQDKKSHTGTVRGLAESVNATKIEYEGINSSVFKTEELEASKLRHEEAVENKDELKSHETTAESKEGALLEKEELKSDAKSEKSDVVLSSTAGKDNNEIKAITEKTGLGSRLQRLFGKNNDEFEEKGEKPTVLLSETVGKDKEEMEAKKEKAYILLNATDGKDKDEFKPQSLVKECKENVTDDVSSTKVKDGLTLYNTTTKKNEENKLTQILEQIDEKFPEYRESRDKTTISSTTANEEFETRDEQSKYVFSATGKKENEFEAHTLKSEPKENLTNGISSEKEKGGLKLNATTAKKDEQQKLIQKLEEINEVPLVEPEPERDIGNNSKQELGPSVMNATPIHKWSMTQTQIFDEIAKKYLRSSRAQIDGQLGKEMEKFNVRFDTKSKAEDNAYLQFDMKGTAECDANLQVDTQSQVEGNAKEKSVVNTFKSMQLEASPQIASSNPFLQDKEIKASSDDYELNSKVVSKSSAEPQDHLQTVSSSKDKPQNHLQSISSSEDKSQGHSQSVSSSKHKPQDHLQSVSSSQDNPSKSQDLAPNYGSRVAEREDVRCSDTTGKLTILKPGAVIRDDPVKKSEPVDLESFQFKDMDDAVERTMKRGDEEFPFDGNRTTHYYTEYKKHWCMGTQDFQPPARPILPNSPVRTIGIKCVEPEIAKETKTPPRSAVEIAQSFIQAQPLPVPEEQQTLAETEPFHPAQIFMDTRLPEINLNDETVTLTELLHRVRERNRIMYCREIGLQMAKNMAALNPQGKCGKKKPVCPPPAPTCPPPNPCPPPPCPPPLPPCPKPCKKKCPTPCPAPVPKCPCKCKAQDAITIALHLGPVVNPAKKLLLPVLVCNLSPALSSDGNASCSENWADVIKQKLYAIKESIQSVFKWLKEDIAMSVTGTRDFTPWTPIPSWPYPVVQKKRRLQCPREGCPTPPPSRPDCYEKPCTGFPKRLTFSVI